MELQEIEPLFLFLTHRILSRKENDSAEAEPNKNIVYSGKLRINFYMSNLLLFSPALFEHPREEVRLCKCWIPTAMTTAGKFLQTHACTFLLQGTISLA